MQFEYLRPVYFLTRWQFYEKARYQLREKEIQDAKVFFNALKHLSEEDKKILSDVYRKSPHLTQFDQKREIYMTVTPIKDKMLCEKYGITPKSFGDKRRSAQENLKYEMEQVYRNSASYFMFRATPSLYLIKCQKYDENNEQYLLGGKSLAKIFHKDDGEFQYLTDLGFTKTPVVI